MKRNIEIKSKNLISNMGQSRFEFLCGMSVLIGGLWLEVVNTLELHRYRKLSFTLKKINRQ
jgi:hypothetical protein